MTSLKRELYDSFQSLSKEGDRLRLELARAQDTISILETEIDAIKFHADAAFAKMAEQMKVPRHTFELTTDTIPGSSWLKDIWLSQPSNVDLLGDAEAAWKEKLTDPREALHIAAQVCSETTNRSDVMMCSLFVAAAMLATGKTEEACAYANEVLRESGNHCHYKYIAGIAHYLRGRVFLEMHSFRQAYWDFSLAVFTPGYHERAKHFQKYSEMCCMDEEIRGQRSTMIADGPNGQPSAGSTEDQRPALKLTLGMHPPTDEFKFEKATITPISAYKDL